MPYTPQTWTDGVSVASAARMTVIENGVKAVTDIAEAPTTLARVAAGTRLAAPLNGSLNTSATAARPSARTDIFFDWYSTVQPNNMLPGDNWDAPA